MITVIVMTDGRMEYMRKTIAGLTQLDGPINSWIIHDDSGSPVYREWMQYEFPDYEIFSTPGRSGFAGAYHSAWKLLRQRNPEWVFSTEDDFVMDKRVPLLDMMVPLKDPRVVQMALLRQPWNDKERECGGVIQCNPESYINHGDWLSHRNFFTTNPSLMHGSMMQKYEWPLVDHSEGIFSHQLFNGTENVSGYWKGTQWCTHIGHERVGHGY